MAQVTEFPTQDELDAIMKQARKMRAEACTSMFRSLFSLPTKLIAHRGHAGKTA